MGPSVPLAPGNPERAISAPFDEPLETDEGWAKYNHHYWRRGAAEYEDFLWFFFGQMFL